jgi:NAD(P)-dependent dehydrogenase (short-subunit alcohol dehydrogenase family)
MTRLDGKVALVTGASTGIGKAIARALAKEGASLALVSRTREKIDRAAAEIADLGVTVFAEAADIADEQAVENLFARTMETYGRLDLLVNNAGSFRGGPLEDLALSDWDRVIATNLTAPMLCTRAAMRIMKPQGGGRIINIASISAQRVRPNMAPYNASKHGVWGLTQSTALEGREHGITCCCLNPGNVQVERRIGPDGTRPDEPMISPDELAEVALTMAVLPPHVEVLEATVIPHMQPYVGRG